MADEQPPKGWYDDPQNPVQERYWTGDQWGEARRPKTDAPPPTSKPAEAKTPGAKPSGLAGFLSHMSTGFKVFLAVLLLLFLVIVFNTCQRNETRSQETRDAYCESFGQDDPDC